MNNLEINKIYTNCEENTEIINDFWNNDNSTSYSSNSSYFSDSSNSSNSLKSDLENDMYYDKYKTQINYANNESEIETNILEMELMTKFDNKMTKDKKMSLIIAVLLEIIFRNDNNKLEKIYNFLNKNDLLDLEVISNNYDGLRQNLSSLINSSNIVSNTQSNIQPNIVLLPDISYDSNNNYMGIEKFKYQKLSKLNNTFINNSNKYRTNFNQIKLLGQGGYGSVYKVFHKYEKKFYAIKKVFITKDVVEENYDIFREVQIYSELTNDHIVRYYGSWIDIDIPSIIEYNEEIKNNLEFEKIDYLCPILFIQMELCDFTLGDYLMTWGEFDTIDNKIDILIQIIKGLEYIHSKNIIHRDIKPDNIFLISNKEEKQEKQEKYTVKIGDFGLCKKYSRFENKKENNILEENMDKLIINYETNDLKQMEIYANLNIKSTNSNVGTGIYRAPEIETKKYDSKIDIYALGIIMFELFLNPKTHSEKIFLISKLKKTKNINLLDNINNYKLKKLIFDILTTETEQRPCLKYIFEQLENSNNI